MRLTYSCTLALLFCTGAALAQSSGNFSASYTPATCSIGAGGALQGGTGITFMNTGISTSSGSGVTLVVRPSLVTGLFTKTKIDTTVSTASADVGIQVCVSVDGSGDRVLPKKCVVYDQRFQQISSQLFSQIAACNTVACTADADCATAAPGATCNNPTGAAGAGICVTPVAGTTCTTTADCATGQACVNGICNATAANTLCNFDMILSTLSAHSFDFVIPVSQGRHTIKTDWSVIGAGTTGNSSVASCVGPGIVTVTQTKVFKNSGDLLAY